MGLGCKVPALVLTNARRVSAGRPWPAPASRIAVVAPVVPAAACLPHARLELEPHPLLVRSTALVPADVPGGRPAFTMRALVNSARDDLPTGRPADRALCRPGDLRTGRPGAPPTGRAADQAIRRPADRPTGRPADRATQRPGDLAVGRSDDAARTTRLGRRGSGPQTRHPCPRLTAAPRRDPTPTWRSRCRLTPTRSSHCPSARLPDRLPTSSARRFRSASVEERTVSALSRWPGNGAVALQLVRGGSRCLSVVWQ